MTDWEKLFTTNKTVGGLTHRTYALKSTMKRILSILWFEYANHRKGSPNGQQIYEMLKITSKVEMQIIKLEAQYTNSCRGGIRLTWPQSAQIGTGPVGRKRRGRLANRPHLLIDWFLAAVGVIATDHYGITGAGFLYIEIPLYTHQNNNNKNN